MSTKYINKYFYQTTFFYFLPLTLIPIVANMMKLLTTIRSEKYFIEMNESRHLKDIVMIHSPMTARQEFVYL